jgi:hypothetical protein
MRMYKYIYAYTYLFCEKQVYLIQNTGSCICNISICVYRSLCNVSNATVQIVHFGIWYTNSALIDVNGTILLMFT